MSSPACVRLATEQPDLRDLAEMIDTVIAECPADSVIEGPVLASFFAAPLAQVQSVLNRFTDYGLLASLRMVRCDHCGTLMAQDEYDRMIQLGKHLTCSQCSRSCHPNDAAFALVYGMRTATRQSSRTTVPATVDIEALLINSTAEIRVLHNGSSSTVARGRSALALSGMQFFVRFANGVVPQLDQCKLIFLDSS